MMMMMTESSECSRNSSLRSLRCVFKNKTNSHLVAGKTLFDDARAKALIIHPLEQLIWGPDPEAAVDRLRGNENIPSVCGRVFKNGEPTYCCRECGVDPT